jgi:hypothetical protein
VASVPKNPTVSGWLYQPFASGPRDGLGVVEGAVASYLTAADAGSTLPALSRQEPLTEALLLSGPEYVSGEVQEASPEVASLPEKLTVSEWLYQPLESGLRPAAAEAAGPVAS